MYYWLVSIQFNWVCVLVELLHTHISPIISFKFLTKLIPYYHSIMCTKLELKNKDYFITSVLSPWNATNEHCALGKFAVSLLWSIQLDDFAPIYTFVINRFYFYSLSPLQVNTLIINKCPIDQTPSIRWRGLFEIDSPWISTHLLWHIIPNNKEADAL